MNTRNTVALCINVQLSQKSYYNTCKEATDTKHGHIKIKLSSDLFMIQVPNLGSDRNISFLPYFLFEINRFITQINI